MLIGNGGANTLDGSTGNDQINGGSGNDVLLVSAGKDAIDGGARTDTIQWNESYETHTELNYHWGVDIDESAHKPNAEAFERSQYDRH